MYTFRPLENAFRVISWGRGLPSTTLAVMSTLGDLEPVDAVLHCDPGWEHTATYEVGDFYLGWLARRGVYAEVIHSGDIRAQGAQEHIHVPFWTASGGPLQRQCTREFKIRPQRQRSRELLGYHPSRGPHPSRAAVEQWIGFTLEEVGRMKDSGVQYVANRWPLIEKRMRRQDCARYLEEQGLPLPAPSSCVGCPYKDARRWLATTPDEFAQAVAFDERNRHNPLAERGNSTEDELYIYRHGPRPLADANLLEDARRGAASPFQLSLFSCEGGYCGV